MQLYFALVHQDEGSAFGIQFPDLPGCFSAADSEEDLITNAQEALALYLEDEAAPQARSVIEINNDPEVKAELAKGAFLIAVPWLTLSGRTKKANITLDAGLLDAIEEADALSLSCRPCAA
ncbi:HicB-like antitoxin of HicAB toxin-antitoxin system [Breoghania corrubedonensis]|uniref:HicB-like antitoxin of HicAB toxin-antitoxin system n=1 Tax=Breoghania corrubedonensis TaxID=665038 RepID=A0A2T5VE64_9HYPH|nr:HicB-like antitoxin of HicAB toxin-antitoxin system [Breoghania corrubedonensis]